MAETDIAEERQKYRGLLEQSLLSLVAKLKERGDILRISLFGSYARGRADLFTGLDVLVIMETTNRIAPPSAGWTTRERFKNSTSGSRPRRRVLA